MIKKMIMGWEREKKGKDQQPPTQQTPPTAAYPITAPNPVLTTKLLNPRLAFITPNVAPTTDRQHACWFSLSLFPWTSQPAEQPTGKYALYCHPECSPRELTPQNNMLADLASLFPWTLQPAKQPTNRKIYTVLSPKLVQNAVQGD